MRSFLKFTVIGLCCVAVAVGVTAWLFAQDSRTRRRPSQGSPASVTKAAPDGESRTAHQNETTEPIPTSLLEPPFERGGFDIALRYTGPISDNTSINDLRDAVRGRGTRGIAALKKELSALAEGPQSTLAERSRRAGINRYEAGQLLMYEGRFEEANAAFAEAQAIGISWHAPPLTLAHLTALRGIAALRHGELSNCVECVGPSSCIFPLAPEAVHPRPAGSRTAIRSLHRLPEESARTTCACAGS